jgi:anti-sigma factor RsiW
VQQLIHGYADRELDLVHNLDIESHLHTCPGCARAYQNLKTLRGALAAEDLRFQAPATLRHRIQSSLRPAGSVPLVHRPSIFPWRWAAVAASLAFVALLTWGTVHILSLPSTKDLVVKELAASHIRSLQTPGHAVDVKSSDEHNVKPWFDDKVDFSVDVKKLKGTGFKLLGGRLDYFNDRPVAVVVYKKRKHLINLFIWRTPDVSDSAPETLSRQNFHMVHWTRAGLAYWAVSNLNTTALKDFVQLVLK